MEEDRRNAELRAALARAGLRCTRQRAAVGAYLRTDRHPTAEQVVQAVRRRVPGISLSSEP